MSVTLNPSQRLLVEITDLFMNIGPSKELSEMLRDILLADAGSSGILGKHSSAEISTMIWKVGILTTFIRNIGNYLPSASGDTTLIANLYKSIDYELFNDHIFTGLSEWVYDGEEDRGLSCLERIKDTANCFQLISELLEAGEKYKEDHHENK